MLTTNPFHALREVQSADSSDQNGSFESSPKAKNTKQHAYKLPVLISFSAMST